MPIWRQNSKKGEKPGRYPGCYTDSFTAISTYIYGVLYCKIHTLSPEFACVAAVAVDRPALVRNLMGITNVFCVSFMSCDGRMPE